MTIKEFAHSAQQHLQARTSGTFKRAHTYELLAAAFGFNSYAAISSEAVFTRRPDGPRDFASQLGAIRQRCIELGYQPATADAVTTELAALLAEHQIDVVSLPELVAELLADRSGHVWDDDDHDADDPHEPPKRILPDPFDDEEISPALLQGLEAAADKGKALAHYALALIYDRDEEDEGQQAISPYWHSQAQQGRVLTGVQIEWAEAYAKQRADADKYALHLRAAAGLGNRHALLDLADRFKDPSFFEKESYGHIDDPVRVAEIAARLGREKDARRWLAIAAESGDIGAMRQLIDEYDRGDLLQCWTWLYLAQLAGTDLTQSKHYAINEDGSEYDDDVGGPAFVAGDDGVELIALSPEQDAVARAEAQRLFAQRP